MYPLLPKAFVVPGKARTPDPQVSQTVTLPSELPGEAN